MSYQQNPYYLSGQQQMNLNPQQYSSEKMDPPPYFNPNQNQQYYNAPMQMGQYNQHMGYQQGQVMVHPMPAPIVIVQPSAAPLASQGGCPFCHQNVGTTQRKVPGCAIWVFTIILFCFTICLFWIPWVMDSCYDKEIVCVGCLGVRRKIKSSFGCD